MSRSIRSFNQENIQDMSRTLLLSPLRKEGIYARAHLADLSQLKQATVTNIVSDFTGWGLTEEVRFLTENKGRRSVGTSINNDDFGVLAIRLVRKDYTVGIFSLLGRLLDRKWVELGVNQPPRVTFGAIIHEAGELVRSSGSRKIITIGVAIPSPYSEKRGRIEPVTSVLGQNRIPIREELQDIFKIPISSEQDANTSVLVQYWHNDEDYKNGVVVYITIGQGTGADIINNGKLLKGCVDVAEEVGHTSICCSGSRCTCGNYGCLENYCSSIAFTKEANRILRPEIECNFRQIFQLLGNGDQVATDISLDACDKLSVGVMNTIDSFGPLVIVIGDEMSHILPSVILERVKSNVKERMLPKICTNMNITISIVSNDSMAREATIVTTNDVFNHPLTYFESNQGDD